MQVASDFQPTAQQAGQIRWSMADGESLIANAWFSDSDDGKSALLIGKESPEPLLEIVADQDEIASRGALVGGGWAGPRSMLPLRLAGWVALLDAYSAADGMPDGTQEVHTRTFRAQYTKDNDRLKLLTVAPNDTRDSYIVRFQR